MIYAMWTGAALTLTYLVYAILKNNKPIAASIAEQTVILDVPEHMLTARPVPKEVRIKSIEDNQDSNWWDTKIQGNQSRVARRRSLEPDQLLLSDTDHSLS
jgi:hypothetical protein